LLVAATAARRLDDAHALADIAWALTQYGSSQSIGSSDAALVGIAEDALAGLGTEPSAIRARTLAALAADLGVSESSGRAYDLVNEALEIARSLDDPITLGWVLLAYRWAARTPDNEQARHPTADELIRIGRQTDQRIFTILGLVNRAMSYREAGDLAKCDATVEQYAAMIGDRAIPPNMRAQLIMFRSMRELLAGDLAEADRIATTVLDLPSAGRFNPAPFFGLARFRIRHLQGRVAEMIRPLEAGSGDTISVMRALAYAHGERPDEAASLLREWVRSGRDRCTRAQLWSGEAVVMAEVAEIVGEAGIASDLLEQLAPYSGRLHGGLVVDGPVDLALAQAALASGNPDRAAHFSSVGIDASRTRRTPVYLARHLLAFAEARRGLGAECAELVPLVTEALELADACGAQLVHQDAARLGLSGLRTTAPAPGRDRGP
jgi:hypothetical protein